MLATPEDRRPWVAVSAVARSLEAGLSLPADIAGEDLIVAISRRPADEYLLVEPDGSVYGVLATADVDRAFRAAAAERSALTDDSRHAAPTSPREAWSGVHRGPLRAGEWVRLVDQKGRRHNIELEPGQALLLQPRARRARRPDRSRGGLHGDLLGRR